MGTGFQLENVLEMDSGDVTQQCEYTSTKNNKTVNAVYVFSVVN